jgi:hypothetical protein
VERRLKELATKRAAGRSTAAKQAKK